MKYLNQYCCFSFSAFSVLPVAFILFISFHDGGSFLSKEATWPCYSALFCFIFSTHGNVIGKLGVTISELCMQIVCL